MRNETLEQRTLGDKTKDFIHGNVFNPEMDTFTNIFVGATNLLGGAK